MSKKIQFCSAIVIIGLFIISLFININGFFLREIWFSISLVCIGLYSLIYSFLYKLDSCFYYGMLNVLFAFATAVRYLTNITFFSYYPIYVLCFAISHFAVFVIFRQKIHFKVFAILLAEGIILLAYKKKFLSLETLIAINGAFLLVIAINMLYRLRKNLRREK